jgi:hypothetical protein
VKRLLVLSSIVLLLSSCYGVNRTKSIKSGTRFLNGAGWYEYERHEQSDHYSKPFRHYHLNGRWWYYESENGDWKEYQNYIYDKYYQEALEKGYNPHWWIDRHWNEDEDNSHS